MTCMSVYNLSLKSCLLSCVEKSRKRSLEFPPLQIQLEKKWVFLINFCDKAVHTAGMKPNAWQCMTVGLLSKFMQDE